jgi:hypothetical protein
MSYTFVPAGLAGSGFFGAIAGASTSGKTLTALRIARGLVGPGGRIAACDTEGGRMSHYAVCSPLDPEIPGRKYDFDVFRMQSPFDPLRFCDIAAAAEEAGYGCMITDNFSLEWSGIGGVRDRYEQRMKALGGAQKHSDVSWAYAKEPHKRMRDRLLQSTMPMLFCIRSNEVPKHLAKDREGTWKPEQDKRFLYEWTLALTLHPNSPGKPRYDLMASTGEPAWKMPDDLRPAFPEGAFITEAAGVAIAKWRNERGATQKSRTVREIARDRLLAAGDEADVAAVLALDSVKRALKDAPEEIKMEIRDMVEGARKRIANDAPEVNGAATHGPDDLDREMGWDTTS